MLQGTIKVRVRPIKVAFLVETKKHEDLCRAITYATHLWGGHYQSIIPVYKRTPRNWNKGRGNRLPTPSDIIDGYLDAFDPDIVVPIGNCVNYEYSIGNRQLVKEEALLGDVNKTLTPCYGVGLHELLSDFVNKELKYKRNDDLHFVLPQLPVKLRTFLGSIFGIVSEATKEKISQNFSNSTVVKTLKVTLENYIESWIPGRMFPRHLTLRSLEYAPHREAMLFLLDATNTQDIIDFWNLRAAGNYVVPIPVQLFDNEKVKTFAKKYIQDNYLPYKHNADMFSCTTIQKSRSITEESVKGFCSSLSLEPPQIRSQPKYVYRFWMPRLWSSLARENSQENVIFPYAYDHEVRIADVGTRFELRTSNPKLDLFPEYSGRARFANEFRFRFFGFKEPMAEVIPEGSRKLASSLGGGGFDHWRFSKPGPVFLAQRNSDLIFMELPRAEVVMMQWFRERGWEVSLSGPGRIAMQMIKQLGGAFGTSWVAHRGVIKLLSDLEKEAGLSRQAVIGQLKKVITEDKLFFDSDRFLEGLLESNALRLGAKIQCPICTRHNWYELNALEYELPCRFCLSEFKPPVKSPKDIEWTYRAHGPFASSTAQGSFTVLLTLKFLGGNFNRSITPLFSYIAKKGHKLLEADISCLYKSSDWKDCLTHLVHAECKSFNRFELRDVERMADLSEEFPSSALIFSMLNESLNAKEVTLISALVRRERKKRLRGDVYSPVIILTGIELFSTEGISSCWRDRGGFHKKLSEYHIDYSELADLADATQQLYLGLPSWPEVIQAKFSKKALRKASS